MTGAYREKGQVLLLCVLTDLALVWAALHLATLTRVNSLHYLDYALLQRDRAIVLLVFAAALLFLDTYRTERLTDRFDSVYYTWAALLVALLSVLFLTILAPRDLRVMSRREILLGSAFSFVLLGMWRAIAASIVARVPSYYLKFCVIGPPDEAARIADAINRARWIHGEACCRTPDALGDATPGNSQPKSLAEDAILVPDHTDRDALSNLTDLCTSRFRRTFLYPGLHEVLMFEHRRLVSVAGIPLLQLRGPGSATNYVRVKRLMDITAALAGLLLSLPLSIAAAIAVKLTSPGGIFFTQERLGKDGKPFFIYKFRTMTAAKQEYDDMGRPVPTSQGDARVTRVGRFLRKHRIDEIPQLFNVLIGDMSLVGPRPLWKDFFDQITLEEQVLVERRLMVRPGVTSLSHVLGAYDSEHRDRLRYDALYINNLSLATDLRVLFATVRIVLSGRGAL
ncbi:MAG: exopolysaccharide biosynthesis polyprenyl glycosylphosphotransferase [bacterium]|nr:exopolysaccharide biosynthesis polyprenyl glycosylphosphotransferase [bacterium]